MQPINREVPMLSKFSLAAFLLVVCALLATSSVRAQERNPTQKTATEPAGDSVPVFHVTVVSRTINAVNYHHRTGITKIGFRGTQLMPEAKGDASVESRMGSTKVDTSVEHLRPASSYGPE